MLTITVPAGRTWNAKTEKFSINKETVITLEHSLVSISKWEAVWHKPFISDDKKSHEETLDYIKHMTITQNVNPNVYNSLSQKNMDAISKYIENKMTATWFNESTDGQGRPTFKKKEIITSELIYYWMIALEIPFECQRWHLNRLLTLIKVCNIKAKSNNNKKSKKDILKSNAELNAARRAKSGSSG